MPTNSLMVPIEVLRKLDLETQAYVEVWDEPKFEEVL
jgi:hypothetical protein